MADRKISDLTALTAPAAGDYLPIVDISEVAAASKNKRITIEELFRGTPDGTAAAPAIAPESDPNTGIYSSGADQLSIATNGTERLRVDSTGQIEAVSLGSAAAPTFSFTGDPNTGIYSPGADQLSIATNGTERARIDSSGRLLVGTSTSTGSVGGTANLQVAGSARLTNGLASTIDVASIALNATTAITLPKHGLYCIFIDSMNLSAIFFATISGGGTGVRIVFSTNATDIVGGLTTEPAGGTYLRLWISGGQLQIKNVNAFVTPYYITPLVTGA
jgi:hypothetical protein